MWEHGCSGEPAGPRVWELNLLHLSVPLSPQGSPAHPAGAQTVLRGFCPAAGGVGQVQMIPGHNPRSVHTGLRSRAALEELLLGKTSPCSGPPQGALGKTRQQGPLRQHLWHPSRRFHLRRTRYVMTVCT